MDRKLRPMFAVTVVTLSLGCAPSLESGEGDEGTPVAGAGILLSRFKQAAEFSKTIVLSAMALRRRVSLPIGVRASKTAHFHRPHSTGRRTPGITLCPCCYR